MNVYVNNRDVIPEGETCYIVGKNGIFLKKSLDLIESLTPIDKISFLDDVSTYAKLKIPKLSVEIMASIIGFFRDIYKLHKSEAVVLMYYNLKTKTYKIYVPIQEVTYSGIDYDTKISIPDHRLVASVHSHSGMSAFHSTTDVGDEAKFDGLHLTIGKMDKPDMFDICGSIAINSMRVPIAVNDYVEGLEVREYSTYFPHMFRPASHEVDGERVYEKDVKTQTGYVLNADEKLFKYPNKWLSKVKERTVVIPEVKPAYQNLFSGKKYVIKDGKLVLAENEMKQATFVDYQRYLSDPKTNKFLSESDDDECVCARCTHRKEKLDLQSIQEYLEEELENEFKSEMWWEKGWE